VWPQVLSVHLPDAIERKSAFLPVILQLVMGVRSMSSAAICKPPVQPSSGPETPSTAWPRILCIDDDPDLCRVLKIQLQNYAVEVFTASFGSQGYWEALVHQPDIIITDLHMPQGSGDYVVECLKRNPNTCRIPVIVLTGRRDQALQSYLQGLGIVQYLVKPVPFDELCRELHRHISLLPREKHSSESQIR
jgi:response regulator RpfG family c-di-GMP phosphodiesterase